MSSGIYIIRSIIKPDRFYIGSSVSIKSRWERHLRDLKNGVHNNKMLQGHFIKYSQNDLTFDILENCDTSILIQKEQYYITLLSPTFNVLKRAYSMLGYKHSEYAVAKIKAKNIGRKMTDEQVRKGVVARMGQRTSKGCKRTPEAKKNLSEKKKKKVLYDGVIYDSLQDISFLLNIKYQTLYAQISGRNFNNYKLSFYA
ncbi:MAG: GIY-YIG nuclease family protein [Parachlamydiaceae bacterium]